VLGNATTANSPATLSSSSHDQSLTVAGIVVFSGIAAVSVVVVVALFFVKSRKTYEAARQREEAKDTEAEKSD